MCKKNTVNTKNTGDVKKVLKIWGWDYIIIAARLINIRISLAKRVPQMKSLIVVIA